MFCLRSWIPILFFLHRTSASPVYLVLFVSATYFLNRPCVYCSLLLAILVVSLFDFHTAWFEPQLPAEDASSDPRNTTMPLRDPLVETASILASAVNSTATTVIKAAADTLRKKAPPVPQISGGAGFEWAKGLVGKKEWRIPCLDVLVRI
ncbi:uncharacterized protein BDZ99DRAFT_487334 [Mytilinidion resinicola]|uniref:Uncharacterized protein n=1 Tax=Mytilinidion resinicola TaxID=574789 RepID=A0A6A6YSE5_9PEZI|nr:uncharacterized protein BDZ99DRAFT_487334 [Mytilinidion resinicola]KAF2811701.1 hypothetical protein BDZ99DRAFT_487334 [Mytilinidion resinicola]